MYAAIGSAIGLAYHLGCRHKRKKEDFVTADQIGPFAVLNTTAMEDVSALVVCHQPGAPYNISPSSRIKRNGVAFANSGNRSRSTSRSMGMSEIFSDAELGYMYGVCAGS